MATDPDVLMSAAKNLAKRHPTQNPLHTPGAIHSFNPQSQAMIAEISASPMHAAVAKGQASATTTTASGAVAAGAAGANPIEGHELYRSPMSRHNIIGFGAVSCPAGVLTGVAAQPQVAFTPSRMVVGATTLGLSAAPSTQTIQNWKVGSKSQFASIGAEPLNLFAAGLQGGRVRFSKCAAALTVNAQVILAVTSVFYACLIGTSGNRKNNQRPPAQYAKEDRVAIPNTTVGPAASVMVQVTPTRKFWGTKIILDDNGQGDVGLAAGTGASNFILTDLLVGSDSQFMTAPSQSGGAQPAVPAGVFNNLYSPTLDLDRANTSVAITFELTNVGSVTAVFGGVILGDVDKRDDVETDDILDTD